MKNLFFIILCSLFFVSCSSVKKLQRVEKTTTDSSVVQSKTASDVKKSDSSGTKNITGDYTKETVYKYDTLYQYVTVGGKIDTVLKYVPRILTVYETGNYNLQQTARQQKTDSNYISVAKQISVLKNSEENIKTKEKSGTPWFVYLFIFLTTTMIVYMILKRLFNL